MIYSLSDEVPAAWDDIISAFITMAEYSVEFHRTPDVYDVEFLVRRGLLYVNFKGGDHRVDSYALFATEMSARVCAECSAKASRRVFLSPRCEECD